MTPEQEVLLRRYAEEVVSSPLHLTSDRELRQFWIRHIQDAVQLHDLIPSRHTQPGCRVLDVGSGNGVPGIPIAILEPEWTVELLDSDTKKCGFIDMICKKYAIKNAHVIVGRAEGLAQGALRQAYDIVFSRALSRLRTAIELAGAFVRVGGQLIVPHGTTWQAELQESALAIELLGLQSKEKFEYELDGTRFVALVFHKIASTPAMFPRATGIPEKKPL